MGLYLTDWNESHGTPQPQGAGSIPVLAALTNTEFIWAAATWCAANFACVEPS